MKVLHDVMLTPLRTGLLTPLRTVVLFALIAHLSFSQFGLA